MPVRYGILLVGHNQLSVHRQSIDYSDKDDEFDAFALAHYCFTYFDDKRRFVQVRDTDIAVIRELVLRLAHLNRVQSPIINRIRQDLAWQFPEASRIVCQRNGDNAPLLWRWLAGLVKSQKYDIETGNGRKNNRLCQQIHAWMKAPERMGTPIKLLRMKTASHAARLLFKKLVFLR